MSLPDGNASGNGVHRRDQIVGEQLELWWEIEGGWRRLGRGWNFDSLGNPGTRSLPCLSLTKPSRSIRSSNVRNPSTPP